MDVTRVLSTELRALRIPLRAPLTIADGEIRVVERGLLHVIAGDGRDVVVGRGEVAGPVPPGAAEKLSLELRGLDVTDARAVAAMLERLDAVPGSGRSVRSAVSSALSDLRACIAGRPLAIELGGARPRSSVTVNGLVGRSLPGLAAARAMALVGEGFRCLKLKGGGEPASDVVGRVAEVRAAVGSGVALRLDLNGSIDAAQVEVVLDRLAAFDLEYVEQPLPGTASTAELARVRRRSKVPIAADESVVDIAAARALLEADAVDALVVKPSRVGGLAEAAAIVEVAAGAGVPVTLSTLLETGVGLAGALQVASLVPAEVAHGLATAALLADDLLTTPLEIADGRMRVPDGPGLGVRLEEEGMRRWVGMPT